jgi:two-component system nitrate/nitrite response regulator NarL
MVQANSRQFPPDSDSAIRVLVVHPNEVVRTGLAAILRGLPTPAQVTLFDRARPAMEMVTERGADVVILSAGEGSEGLSDGCALRLTEEAERAGTKILLLVKSADRKTVHQITAVRCDGVLVEEGITSAVIGEALSQCRDGDMPVPTTVVRGLLSEVRTLRDQKSATAANGSHLTPRELATLELLVEGLSNKEIARRLCISQHGVKRHVANILAKLNCPNRTLAAARAIKEGLVGPSLEN